PSVAMPAIRHYTHDAWHSVSATVALPGRGVLMGALAPMLTPALAGERRSFTVCYPVLTQRVADRQVGKATMVAEVTSGVRARFGVKERAKHHQDAQAADAQDHRLTQGATLTRPYAVLTVTVPNTHSPGETGRAMDASI